MTTQIPLSLILELARWLSWYRQDDYVQFRKKDDKISLFVMYIDKL